MKEILLESKVYRFSFPTREEPQWKSLVDRWYQLDAQAFGLAQAYWTWKPELTAKPSLVFLASPGASNETDHAFASTGAFSPAKFVHTLPNVRCSPLCQVMSWVGQMFCIQCDPRTQISALSEAADWVGDEYPEVWVIGVAREGDRRYCVRAWILSAPVKAEAGTRAPSSHILRHGPVEPASPTDLDLAEWLDSETPSTAAFKLLYGWQMERRKV